MDKQWLIGIVIPAHTKEVEVQLKKIIRFYESKPCSLVIINQHEDQWVSTLADYYLLTNKIEDVLEARQQTFKEWGPKLFAHIHQSLVSFIFLNESMFISPSYSLSEPCIISSEHPVQLSQIVQSKEQWMNELEYSWMEIVEHASNLPKVKGKVEGEQTIFNGDYSLAALRQYQLMSFHDRAMYDMDAFVSHFQPQYDMELSETQWCVKKILDNNALSQNVQSFLSQKKVLSSVHSPMVQRNLMWKSFRYSLHSIKKMRFYFSSQRRDGGQPYQLYMWLQEHYPDGDYIWEKNGWIDAIGVDKGSKQALEALFTAHYIITDQNLPNAYVKRKGQVIIKCLAYPMYRHGVESPLYQSAIKERQTEWKMQIKNWDLLIVPDKEVEERVQNEFGMIKTMVGRFQIPVATIDDLKLRFQFNHSKRIILFYPQDTTTVCPIHIKKASKDCWIAPSFIQPMEGLNIISDARIDELVKVADIIVTDGNPDVFYYTNRPIYWLTSTEQWPVLKKWMYASDLQKVTLVNIEDGTILQEAKPRNDNLNFYDMESLWQLCLQTKSQASSIPACLRIGMKGIQWRQYYKKVFDLLAKRPKKNIIVFESFYGKQFSDNPRALYEYIKENYPEYQLYWMTTKKQEAEFKAQGMNTIRHNSWQELWIQTKAKYWVVNMRLPQWKYPGRGTRLIQTWHGTPLKTLGLDIQQVTMPGVTTDEYRKQFLTDVSKWDYLIAPNEYSSRIFQRAFHLPQQKMILSGYPRNDILFHIEKEQVKQIREELHILPHQKVVLYAPTWRDTNNQGQGSYYLGLQLDLDAIQSHFGNDVVILIRAHYLISEQLDLTDYPFARDVSHYPDISYLYEISDVLITDYSSVFFDYANLRRPMIFYAYDEKEYAGDMRGFYFNYQNVPGPIVHTTSEVITALEESFSHPKLSPRYESFIQKYTRWEQGDASKKVWDVVLSHQEYAFETKSMNQQAMLCGRGFLYKKAFPETMDDCMMPLSAYRGQSVSVISQCRAIDPIHHQPTSMIYVEIILHRFDGQEIRGFVLTESLQFDVS